MTAATRKSTDTPIGRKVVAWLCACCALALTVVVCTICRNWLINQPVVNVVISGKLHHSDRVSLRALVEPQVGKGMLDLNAAELRQILLAESWVDSVTIRKQWPDQVLVDVVEQVPVAYWQTTGFVNHRGELFFPPLLPESMTLPRLFGEAVDGEEIFDIYQRLNSVMKPRDLAISTLHKSRLGIYTAALNDGTSIVFEAENTMAQLSKLITVYDRHLVDVREHVARIDLRYNNGLAVAWKQPLPVDDKEQIKGINHES